MDERLLNGFNNGRDASDGVGGQPSPLQYQFIHKSKTLQKRHEDIKLEMFGILDAIKLLDDQYKSLEHELYSIEQEYMNNLKNLVE